MMSAVGRRVEGSPGREPLATQRIPQTKEGTIFARWPDNEQEGSSQRDPRRPRPNSDLFRFSAKNVIGDDVIPNDDAGPVPRIEQYSNRELDQRIFQLSYGTSTEKRAEPAPRARDWDRFDSLTKPLGTFHPKSISYNPRQTSDLDAEDSNRLQLEPPIFAVSFLEHNTMKGQNLDKRNNSYRVWDPPNSRSDFSRSNSARESEQRKSDQRVSSPTTSVPRTGFGGMGILNRHLTAKAIDDHPLHVKKRENLFSFRNQQNPGIRSLDQFPTLPETEKAGQHDSPCASIEVERSRAKMIQPRTITLDLAFTIRTFLRPHLHDDIALGALLRQSREVERDDP
mmetsp:Transcript_8660/g.17579  ORF Transcript_8660/g.17579 Transcript_8660/m.17579 type:complete len:340 (+) Transcript_8660:737-1756(+)